MKVKPDFERRSTKKFIRESFRRPSKRLLFIHGTLMVLFLVLLNPTCLFAQMIGPMETGERLRFGGALGSSYQFKSNATGGGDLSISRYSLMIGSGVPLNDKTNLALRLSYDFEDYDISNLKGFSVSSPWNKIDRVGLGAGVSYKLNESWSLRAGPIVQYAGERGADFGDSLMYGGIISASYRVNRNLLIGFGGGVFYRLEETSFFPAFLISWNITDRLRLGNSYRLGPMGPAGLELTYNFDKNWELGAGGGYRSSRFRLDSNGPVPGGIGENDNWPVYVRISRNFRQLFNIDLFGGAAFGGKLKLNDSSGNEINSVSYDTTPIIGLTVGGRF